MMMLSQAVTMSIRIDRFPRAPLFTDKQWAKVVAPLPITIQLPPPQ